MNEKDLLAAVNKVLGQDYAHVCDISVAQLVRANLIVQLNHLSEYHMSPVPQAGEQALFFHLEPGALFHRVGETRILEKLAPAEVKQAMFCPFRNCPPDEVKFNATADDDIFHVCPNTPVVEVPF